MATAFTPGPWTFSQDDQFGDTRFYVAQQEGAPYTPNYSDVATLIAETCSGERVAVQQANAHLIAAAPELLEAMKKRVKNAEERAFEDWLARERPSGDVESVQRQWEESSDLADMQAEWSSEIALIAKATGSTP